MPPPPSIFQNRGKAAALPALPGTAPLWGIGFHAVVVFGLGKDFLFKSILGRCVLDTLSLTDQTVYFFGQIGS